MAGIWTIARKEFKDHVSDRAFLLCFTALLIAMAGGALHFTQRVSDWTSWSTSIESGFTHLWVTPESSLEEPAGWKFHYNDITRMITSQLSSLGVLVAIALSFNSINKERTEGSLKVLLSYPIYRDKIILGKLLAGFLVLTLVTVASMTISFSIIVYYLSIPLTLDFLLRVAATTAMGVMLLSFFLCVGTAVSTVLRDTSTIFLSLILVSSLLRYGTYRVVIATVVKLLSVVGIYFEGPGKYYPTYFFSDYIPSFRNYARLSPIEAFIKLSERFFNYGRNYERFQPVYPRQVVVTFQDQLYGHLDLVAVPIIFTIAAFIACYILFTRRDVA